jgi:hypothetical protein
MLVAMRQSASAEQIDTVVSTSPTGCDIARAIGRDVTAPLDSGRPRLSAEGRA